MRTLYLTLAKEKWKMWGRNGYATQERRESTSPF